MNWAKRNLSFVLGAVTALVLMGLAGFYLYSGFNKNTEVESKLNDARGVFQGLWNSEVFPDESNIAAAKEEKKRLEAFKKQFGEFFQLVKYQEGLSGLQFSRAVYQEVDEMRAAAEAASITLPPDFNFAFSSPKGGPISDKSDVNAVANQLAEVREICQILFKADQVRGVRSIKRARLSKEDLTAGSYEQEYHAFLPTTNAVTKAILMPYEVTFRAFSKGLADTLNALKSSPYGFVIESIEIKAEAERERLVGGASEVPGLQQTSGTFFAQQLDRFTQQPQLPIRRGPPSRPGGQRGGGGQNPTADPNAPKTHLAEEPVTVTLKLQVVRLK